MQDFTLSAWPLAALAGLGPLIIGIYLRMAQVEAQLRALGSDMDSQAIELIAGCMIRSRSCRAALLLLYAAGFVLTVLALANLSAQALGWPALAVTPLGVLIAAAFVALALVLTSIEACLSLEPVELLSRRKLNAARET